jgi:putative Ca2+/H+ antiporter (TMEM165/GDT1 family)
MKLSVKQKALLVTFGLLGSMILGSGIIVLIGEYFSAQAIGNMLGVIFLSGVVYLLYSITLNRLEYEESVKNLSKKD